MDWQGRSVAITGAGKGIGRASVEMFARAGAEIVAISRSPRDLAELESAFGCRTIAVDLADALEAAK